MTDKILIVEDELIVARDIRRTLEKAGHKVIGVVQTVEKAMIFVRESRPSLVLIDIFLKGNETGIDLALQLNAEGIPFIYISANSNQPVLEAAKQTNPYGFIVKPFREKDLLVTIDIAHYRYENDKQMKKMAQADDLTAMKQADKTPLAADLARSKSAINCSGLIGKSPQMQEVFRLIERVAPFDTSVLLLGESGTGKEVVANCIYQLSSRNKQPFIKINCAAIPSGLMESELFGYEKGSFTGASERKIGKFEQAAGGTILLDEIGELPLDMQAKLLRVLQEKEVLRIGSSTPQHIDVRILAATNQNLEKEVADGKFRLDLYYRLYVFPILLPPLRERKEDIPILLRHFMEFQEKQLDKKMTKIDDSSYQKLLQYSWPGNVRELQHLVERSMLMANDDILHVALPEERTTTIVKQVTQEPSKSLEEIERAHILSILQQCNFKISGHGGAAELLNLSPNALLRKLKKLGIEKMYSSND